MEFLNIDNIGMFFIKYTRCNKNREITIQGMMIYKDASHKKAWWRTNSFV